VLAEDGEMLELRDVMMDEWRAITYLPKPDGWVRTNV
jgi:hypothetical protein